MKVKSMTRRLVAVAITVFVLIVLTGPKPVNASGSVRAEPDDSKKYKMTIAMDLTDFDAVVFDITFQTESSEVKGIDNVCEFLRPENLFEQLTIDVEDNSTADQTVCVMSVKGLTVDLLNAESETPVVKQTDDIVTAELGAFFAGSGFSDIDLSSTITMPGTIKDIPKGVQQESITTVYVDNATIENMKNDAVLTSLTRVGYTDAAYVINVKNPDNISVEITQTMADGITLGDNPPESKELCKKPEKDFFLQNKGLTYDVKDRTKGDKFECYIKISHIKASQFNHAQKVFVKDDKTISLDVGKIADELPLGLTQSIDVVMPGNIEKIQKPMKKVSESTVHFDPSAVQTAKKKGSLTVRAKLPSSNLMWIIIGAIVVIGVLGLVALVVFLVMRKKNKGEDNAGADTQGSPSSLSSQAGPGGFGSQGVFPSQGASDGPGGFASPGGSGSFAAQGVFPPQGVPDGSGGFGSQGVFPPQGASDGPGGFASPGGSGSWAAQGGPGGAGDFPSQGASDGSGSFAAQGVFPSQGASDGPASFARQGGSGSFAAQGVFPSQGGPGGSGSFAAQGGPGGAGVFPSQGASDGSGSFAAQGVFPSQGGPGGAGDFPPQGASDGPGGFASPGGSGSFGSQGVFPPQGASDGPGGSGSWAAQGGPGGAGDFPPQSQPVKPPQTPPSGPSGFPPRGSST